MYFSKKIKKRFYLVNFLKLILDDKKLNEINKSENKNTNGIIIVNNEYKDIFNFYGIKRSLISNTKLDKVKEFLQKTIFLLDKINASVL